jgi:hypothetical protein
VLVEGSLFVVVVFTVIVFAALFVLFMAMQSRRHIREMEHRERLAMIERGLMPPPELDPGGFDAAIAAPGTPENRTALRWRTAGVMMMGMGLAFMFLMSFSANDSSAGIGVGGAFALIGAAFFVNAMLSRNSESRMPVRPPVKGLRRAETDGSPKSPTLPPTS